MAKSWIWVALLFTLVLGIRLFFAFQTPNYSSDESYLHTRTIETMTQGNTPWNDQLGGGGRTLITSPLYDIIMAFFTLIMPIQLALKIIPNIFATLLIIPAYLISKQLTNNTKISLLAALLASIVPAYITNTFNHPIPLTLAIPIFFFLTYAWLQTPQKKWIITFLILLLIFSFLHPLSILFALSLGTYIILTSIEKINQQTEEYELGLFAIFFTLWAQFLLYKKLILFHGPQVIWQNIPTEMLSAFYANITILGAITQIGIFPLIDGAHSLYKTAFKEPKKETTMLLSITIISTLMLWLKLIDLKTGLILLGITLAISFSHGFLILIQYLKETKISKYTWIILTIITISAIATTAYPAYTGAQKQLENTITHEETNALEILSQTTPENSIIIAPAHYGNYITAIAKRKNIIDNYFLLQPRINEKYQDVQRIYKTPFETEAVELFDKYKADYLVIPPGMKDVAYAEEKCFKRIHATSIRIYEKNPECKIKVVA